MWIWLPRDAAMVDLSGLTAMPRTGVTLAGGTPTIIFGFSRTVAGALAPWSIHNLMSASSVGVNGSSFFGGISGFSVLPHTLMSKLWSDLAGTMGAPRLPPLMSD